MKKLDHIFNPDRELKQRYINDIYCMKIKIMMSAHYCNIDSRTNQ